MKAITIRLPDVEAAMLVEVQKRRKDFRERKEALVANHKAISRELRVEIC